VVVDDGVAVVSFELGDGGESAGLEDPWAQGGEGAVREALVLVEEVVAVPDVGGDLAVEAFLGSAPKGKDSRWRRGPS